MSENYYKNTGELIPELFSLIAVCGLKYWFEIIICFVLGTVVSSRRSSVISLLWIFCLCAAFNAFMDTYSWFVETKAVIGRYNFKNVFFSSPGASIQLSILGFSMALPLLSFLDSRTQKILVKFCMFLFVISIITITTRQAQFRFILFLSLYYVLYYRAVFKGLGILVLISVFVSIFLTTLGSENILLYSSLFSNESDDVLIRISTIQSAWDLFQNNIFFGIGYGMFSGHNTIPMETLTRLDYVNSAHNGLLAILSDLGILTSIFIIYFVIFILRILFDKTKSKGDNAIRSLSVSIFVMQLILSLESLISNFHLLAPPNEYYYLTFGCLYWLFIGLGVSIDKKVI